MDIVLVTGFLGAGKTTRIVRWLERAQTGDTALIVNEVGQIGLDSILIGQADNAVQMQLLANGCLCCSAGNSPGPVIAQLADAHLRRTGRTLQRVVIEASGLARPSQLLRELAAFYPGFSNALRVVCVIDARTDLDLQAQPEALDQLACADFILRSRGDLASAVERQRCTAAISRINPFAVLVDDDDLAAAIEAPHVPILRFDAPQLTARASGHDVVVAIVAPRRTNAGYLIEWMENLAGACGAQLLRIKGLVELEGAPGLVCAQSVGGLISPLQPLAREVRDQAPFLVVIARQLEPQVLSSCDPEQHFPLRKAV
ncbi:CobW family GTP-binding protein [Pseudoxanthomonas winnipegensis]|uniref:CobW family GTP-binding protein n=1 Tax=Pseudoxanthomonas winnipegensis TaxID=2480810 RepID=UPI003F87ADF9